MSRHPNDRRLRQWLEDGIPSKVEAHVSTCERCVDRLEAIEEERAPLEAALSELLAPDPELESAMLGRVSDALERREAVEAFVGLIGLGVETARVVLIDVTDPNEPRIHQEDPS